MSQRDIAGRFLAKAQADLDALRALVAADGITDWVIGFHAQQAVEKALKALVVISGGELRRTHDLTYLLDVVARSGITVPAEVASAA